MTDLAIDYAWTHPDPAAIKAAGYSAVLRYLSHDPSKDITADEITALHAAGLSIGLVWETTATRALGGAAAGLADRQEAEQRAAALGYPTSCPIFYADDDDTTAAAVTPYYQGAAGGAYPVGGYGPLAVVDALLAQGLTGYSWEAAGWNGGRTSATAHLCQRLRPTLPPIAGGGYDENAILRPLPLWEPGGDMTLTAADATFLLNFPIKVPSGATRTVASCLFHSATDADVADLDARLTALAAQVAALPAQGGQPVDPATLAADLAAPLAAALIPHLPPGTDPNQVAAAVAPAVMQALKVQLEKP